MSLSYIIWVRRQNLLFIVVLCGTHSPLAQCVVNFQITEKSYDFIVRCCPHAGRRVIHAVQYRCCALDYYSPVQHNFFFLSSQSMPINFLHVIFCFLHFFFLQLYHAVLSGLIQMKRPPLDQVAAFGKQHIRRAHLPADGAAVRFAANKQIARRAVFLFAGMLLLHCNDFMRFKKNFILLWCGLADKLIYSLIIMHMIIGAAATAVESIEALQAVCRVVIPWIEEEN